MNKNKYTSILKDELTSFMKLQKTRGLRTTCGTTLRKFDDYLVKNSVNQKEMSSELIDDWISESFNHLNINTVRGYVINYIQFAKYLHLLGIYAYMPIPPAYKDAYTPYIFSGQEIGAIFKAADNMKASVHQESELYFPMILRLLYGCGLRLSEALSLTFSDVDTDSGILYIRKAKCHKERLVPMDSSLTNILRSYCKYVLQIYPSRVFLFETSLKTRLSDATARQWFLRVLSEAGISLLPAATDMRTKTRNICPNCFRHTFAVTSLHLQHIAGIDNYRVTPLLSVYLGHSKLKGTQKYLHMSAEISEDIYKETTSYSKGLFPEAPREE